MTKTTKLEEFVIRSYQLRQVYRQNRSSGPFMLEVVLCPRAMWEVRTIKIDDPDQMKSWSMVCLRQNIEVITDAGQEYYELLDYLENEHILVTQQGIKDLLEAIASGVFLDDEDDEEERPAPPVEPGTYYYRYTFVTNPGIVVVGGGGGGGSAGGAGGNGVINTGGAGGSYPGGGGAGGTSQVNKSKP